ncbi:hypothetical protein GCM10010123_13860 [Pilimelia anulata]|uniref:Uncharacterized protein n=1 Tax=Pilimelia anulata TaxID=53371 RepID=A0A8J3F736_9ACTN|nr:hypothetical protein [Pilimelia anulata]GGJ85395.1 hypothetical protein GCM10010123_13860 [Pilimelia anulata]
MAGVAALPTAALTGLVRSASACAVGADDPRALPVAPALGRLLPGGVLRRGSTVAVAAGASLVMALLAEASRTGSWCAVVGVPAFGVVAAAELGIALDRLALVPHPGADWPAVVAALIDGVDVVVVAAPPATSAALAQRLAARARQRGCVLVPYGKWVGADVTLRPVGAQWLGPGRGRGRLHRRRLAVAASGRGSAARGREVTLWLPDARGALGAADGDGGAPGAAGGSGA